MAALDFSRVCPDEFQLLQELKTWKETLTESQTEKDQKIDELQQKLETANEEIATLKKSIEDITGGAADSINQLVDDIRTLQAFDLQTLTQNYQDRWAAVEPKLDSVNNMDSRLAEQDAACAAAKDLAKAADDRVKECDLKLKKFDNEWAIYKKDEEKLQDTIRRFDAGIKRIETTQQETDAKFAKKYAQMWQEVPKSLEEMNQKRVIELERQLQKNSADKVAEVQNLVKYCLQILAKVQSEKKSENDKASLLLHWRQQAWNQAQRRVGCLQLARFMRGRLFAPWHRWKNQARYESTIKRITEEYTRRIPDVAKQMDALGVPTRLETLNMEINRLEHQKATKDELQSAMDKGAMDVDQKFSVLQTIKSDISGLETQMTDAKQKVESVYTDCDSLNTISQNMATDLVRVKDDIETNYASNTAVQAMVKDVLLVWYSIKQLDTTKADKKDMEAYALEAINREKIAVREEVRKKTEAMDGEIMTMQTNVDQIDLGFQRQGQDFKSLEEMLVKLVRWMEELVLKLFEMGGVDVPPGADQLFGGEDLVTNMEQMESWLANAKGMVDESLNNYMTSGGGMSARGRRPKPTTGTTGGSGPGTTANTAGAGGLSGVAGRGISAGAKAKPQARR